MASIAFDSARPTRDLGFVPKLAVVMAATVVAGFSMQLYMGRSTFGAPLRVHLHAVVFMGWVALFVTQSWLATRGPLALHRRLGWIGAIWMVLMLAVAMNVIVASARNATVPFFFTPQHFLIADPATLLCFLGLTGSAIMLRRETDWHARLHVCGMTAIMGPAFGRLLPMPLLIPWAFEWAAMAGLIFPAIGAIRDRRVTGRVHPAWWCGIGAILATIVLAQLVTHSSLGDAIYRKVTAGYPGASVAPLGYPPLPSGPLVTGR